MLMTVIKDCILHLPTEPYSFAPVLYPNIFLSCI